MSGGKSALVEQSIVAYEDIEEKDRVALLLSPDQVDLESANSVVVEGSRLWSSPLDRG